VLRKRYRRKRNAPLQPREGSTIQKPVERPCRKCVAASDTIYDRNRDGRL
jgi:hypothetical protein